MLPKKDKAPRAAANPSQPKPPRKQRAPAPKPPGWTNANWAAELARRRTVTTDRRNRGVMKKSREKAIAVEEASRATMMQKAANAHVVVAERRVNTRPAPPPLPPHHHLPSPYHQPSPHHLTRTPLHLAGQYLQGMWPSHQSVASLSNYSPPVWRYSTSPDYADGDPHGGFNPNTAFPLCPPPRSPSGLEHCPSPPLPRCRRGPNEGEGEEKPTAKGRKRKRQAPTGLTVSRFKWAPKEDGCLAEAWKTVSIDPITGANQNDDKYWKRIKRSFDERRLLDPEYAGLTIERGHKQAKAMKAEAPAAERVQVTIKQCIADANTHALAKEKMAIAREEKVDARRTALMKKSDMKLELLKSNVAAKKRNKDFAFLQAGDPATMTPQVAAWSKTECDLILN
ncbi:unnamed protein product [Alopecurus aequalis]